MIASVAYTVFTFFFTVNTIVSSATSQQSKTSLLVTFVTCIRMLKLPFFKVRNPKTVLQTRFISIILFIIKVSEKVECFVF